MIAHRQIDDIILLIVGAAVIVCLFLVLAGPELIREADLGVSMEYEKRVFDTSAPVVIDIRMDPDEWQTMLDTSTQEVYHVCDVEIDGVTFRSVGIRPKGNTSLSSIAMNPNTERYSFKLEFDRFVDGQTAWGLDKLCLNNNYADATNMKEAMVYDMYRFLDTDASLYNEAEIYVNGEYWGVYLALEAVEDSFMLRNYGTGNGALYKPDMMGMSWGGMDDGDRWPGGSAEPRSDPSPAPTPTATPEPTPTPTPEPTAAPGASGEADGEQASGERRGSAEMRDFSGGPFGFGGGGQNLNYIDDDLSSYYTIWGSEVTKTSPADHRRVVEALKHNSEQTDVETYMDVDNLIRYMAVHNFSVNGDSLSGGMAHNYYLYESDGRLNVIPWDYNLSMGSMGGGSRAKSVVNDPIDDSWQSTDFFDFILDNEEYLARYHAIYRRLVEEYVLGGGFDEFYSRTRGQIDDLVAEDPNALYDYDEYDAAAETLYRLVKLRGESVLGQLNGTIPSTTAGQRADSTGLIEADGIDLSVMGSMSMGGSFGGGGGFPGGRNPFRRDASEEASGETSGSEEQPADTASGEAASAEPTPTPGASGEAASAEPTPTPGASGEAASAEPTPTPGASGEEETSASGERSDRRSAMSASAEMQRQARGRTILLLAVSAAVLIGAIFFAARFRKKG